MTDTDRPVRVLFVDDEPKLLKGLERSLFSHGPDGWEFEFAESGERALEQIAEAAFDVVVSDMRMPAMDGAELLRQIAHGHPETLRIVLSGHTEVEAAVRAMPVAHQFLSKPMQPDDLVALIRSGLAIRDVVKNPKVRAVAGEVEFLPPRPRIYLELIRVLNDEKSSVADVANVVEQDPAIAAKVLHVANSAFFSRGMKIASVREAVARLGAQVLRGVVLSMDAFSSFRAAATPRVERKMEHCFRVASVAWALAKGKAEKELVFTAGLLHDIGQVLLCWKHPEAAAQVEEKLGAGATALEAERDVLGTSHPEIGAYLLGLWGLPFPVIEAVLNHHMPETPAPAPSAWTLYLAEAAVCSADPGEEIEERIDMAVIERAGKKAAYETAVDLVTRGGAGERR